jgi:alpha-L-fucosidase
MGVAGETNLNTINTDTLYAGKPDVSEILQTGSPDGKQWIPAEVDVSIRPGWFYHAKEDSLVKTPQQLFDIYLSSVGRGSTLLLNVPPDRRGLFHANDVQSLKGFRKLLDSVFAKNLALNAKVTAASFRGNDEKYAAANLTDGDKNTYWATDDGVDTGSLEISLPAKSVVKYVVLQEYIQLGQRVSNFAVEGLVNGQWQRLASGTTIGHKRILQIDPVETDKIRVTINAAKACPVISNVELY